jgi:hypothetical protein
LEAIEHSEALTRLRQKQSRRRSCRLRSGSRLTRYPTKRRSAAAVPARAIAILVTVIVAAAGV